MRPCTRTALALVTLFLPVAPLWARPNIANLAHECKVKGKQNACSELAKIAVENKDPSVRQDAVAELTDQSLLAKIAVDDKSDGVRQQAVSKLSDQPLLARIAVEDTAARVREAAVEKLTDQALLAKVALEGKPPGSELAVQNLTDQSWLGRIALQGADASARKDALEKLTDPSLLAKVAMEDQDASARKDAVARLADQPLLAKIVLESTDPGASVAAVWKLTDQTLLAKIALDSKIEQSRNAAKAALAEWKTVTSTSEVYIYKAPSQDSSVAPKPQWKISGVLGAADLNPLAPGQSSADTMTAMVAGQAAFMELVGSSSGPTPSRWQFAPEDENDTCILESGSVIVSFGRGEKEIPGPVSFTGRRTNGKRMWGISAASSDAAVTVFFQPKLYLTSDGTLVLGGLWASYGLRTPSGNSTAAPGFFATSVSTVRETPVSVTGTIRFPKDRWTPAGAGFNVKGGGLQFDETGAFLIPGTEYRKAAQ